MIKHIVMWNIRSDTPEARAAGIARLQRSFESLRGKIPGLAHLKIGVNASHPEHLRVKGELADLRSARHQVDYEGPPGPRPAPHTTRRPPMSDNRDMESDLLTRPEIQKAYLGLETHE